MPKVVLIEKTGEAKCSNLKKFDISTLFKKCKFKDNQKFTKRHTWKYENKFVSIFTKDDGRANTENKYDLPPPLDNDLYFGCMLLCLHTTNELKNDNVENFTLEQWKELYEKLMGGFDDLDKEEERSVDGEDYDTDDLTKEGYLKNSFIAGDDEEIEVEDNDGDESEHEYSGDETTSSHEYETGDSDYESDDSIQDGGDNSELDEEEYNYE